MTDAPHPERRNFYGRTHGKTLRASQKTYLAEDLGKLSLPGIRVADNPDRTPLDIAALTGGRPLWLEVGFGGGEHLVHMAARYPDMFIIGCEPFVNGVAMLLGKIRDAGVTNLALHPGDVRDLFDVLPDLGGLAICLYTAPTAQGAAIEALLAELRLAYGPARRIEAAA